MRKEIYYSGFTFKLNPPYGIDLKVSKLGFLTIGIPDIYYTRLNRNLKEYKHKEFAYDIFKSQTIISKIAEEQKKKDKYDYFMKPFETARRWQALETDNLVYCFSNSFIDDIKKKQKQPRIFKKFLLGSFFAILISFLIYKFFGLFVLTVFFIFLREVANYDDRRIISVVFYDLDDYIEKKYSEMKNAFLKSEKIELVKNSENHGKDKAKKEKIEISEKYTDLIKTNIDIFKIKMSDGHILFFPDKLIAFYKNGDIVGYDYSDLSIKGGKVKLKDGKILSYLSLKDFNDFHLLFYIDDDTYANTIIENLTALQKG